MSPNQTIARYLAAEIFGDSEAVPGDHDDLLVEHEVDSIGVMLLVGFLQEEFGIVVPAEEVTIENFQSVARIAAYVESKR